MCLLRHDFSFAFVVVCIGVPDSSTRIQTMLLNTNSSASEEKCRKVNLGGRVCETSMSDLSNGVSVVVCSMIADEIAHEIALPGPRCVAECCGLLRDWRRDGLAVGRGAFDARGVW